MTPRPYTPTDHPTLASWWAAHNWPPVAHALLPPTGYVIDDICAGFLYLTDSPFCLIEWVIANPESDKIERAKALDILLATLIEEARRRGSRVAFTSCMHPALIERYQKHGFVVSETGMTNLVRSID